jgi:hypothetical protein
MQYKGKDEGLLIQDEDGNVYFLRPEILEATKVPEGDTQFVASRSAAGVLGRIRVDNALDPSKLKDLVQVRTVMCPW